MDGIGRGIPESGEIGFTIEAGLEAVGWRNLIQTISASGGVRAVEGGSSRHEAAGQFAVSVSFVVKLMQRFQATGSFKPGDFGGHKEPKLARHEAVVRELIEQAPSATLRDNELDFRGLRCLNPLRDGGEKRQRLVGGREPNAAAADTRTPDQAARSIIDAAADRKSR